jgi:hypothetical protein
MFSLISVEFWGKLGQDPQVVHLVSESKAEAPLVSDQTVVDDELAHNISLISYDTVYGLLSGPCQGVWLE